MASICNLPMRVRDQFKLAQSGGDLTFYETQVSILQCRGLPFQVRYSPALANKPRSNKPKDPNKEPFNPFANPEEGLLITNLDSHRLVLNKYPVIPNHFILATKIFKLQTHLLEEDDIRAAYACLQSYRDDGEELFGFFNSGEFSGASQSHRHIQFLPVQSMKSGMSEGQDWSVLADSLVHNPDLPFTYFSSALPQAPTSKQLHNTYINLHQKACTLTPELTATPDTQGTESPISYNLGFTTQAMILCPRTSEGIKIKSVDGELVGPVFLNGTVLGGTLLVKSEAEWNALRNDVGRLEEILSSIGISIDYSPNKKL